MVKTANTQTEKINERKVLINEVLENRKFPISKEDDKKLKPLLDKLGLYGWSSNLYRELRNELINLDWEIKKLKSQEKSGDN